MFKGVQPDRLRKRYKETIGHPAKAADNLEGFPRALMKIAESTGPACGVKFRDGSIRLGDQMAAQNIGTRFAVREVQNDFVDAPAWRRRLIEPHFFWKLAQDGCKQRGRAPEGLQHLPPFVACHAVSQHTVCLVAELRRAKHGFAACTYVN